MLAAEKVAEKLKKMAKQISTPEEIEQVATISANGDVSVGKLLSRAMKEVGKDGAIIVKSGKKLEDELEVIKGIKFDKGYISPYFINTKKGKVEFGEALILVSEAKITAANYISRAMEIAYSKKRPLVVIADEVEGDALATLVINKMGNNLQVFHFLHY
jgi:chaperonin GroEL